VLTTTKYDPSTGRDGAKNTTFPLPLNDVTVVETGTGDREETRDTDMSEATTARMLDENRVTDTPPTVETTEGDTKFMDGMGRDLGSKQYVSEHMSF
jgi:hypothetical protein